METERWQRTKDLVYRALELPADARDEFLARECAGDQELFEEVVSLLQENDADTAEPTDVFPAPIFVPVDERREDRTPAAARETDGAPAGGRTRICPRCKARFETRQRYCASDGEMLVEDPETLVGTTLDGLYQVEALLGTGAMGAVYRARHVVLDDLVAIKILLGDPGDPELLRRFRREGRAARRFRHENAVVVHDLRTSSDGLTYLVLEYVAGRTLRVEMRGRSQMSVERSLEIIHELAEVLDAAHGAGVVHRDVKPENVMLGTGKDGQTVVKLLDLGIAKLREIAGESPADNTTLTRRGSYVGTPAYMSPEQWGAAPRDGGVEIDGRTDVYSLAVMTYEMVGGARPFRGRMVEDYRRAHLSAQPPPLREHADVSEAFERAVLRALSKDRADRQPTAGGFARELRAALEGCAKGGDGTPDESQSEAATIRFAESPTAYGVEATGELTESPEADPAVVNPEPAVDPDRQDTRATDATASVRPRPALAPRTVASSAILAIATIVGLLYLIGTIPTSRAPQRVPPTKPPPQDDAIALRFHVAYYGGDRASGLDPLPRERPFRLRFASETDGSLYLLERKETGLTTLLTAVPGLRSGRVMNALQPGQDVEFPTGESAAIGFDESEAVTLVVIFAPEPLSSPPALVEAPGRALTEDETRELDALLAASTGAPAVKLVDDKSNVATVVSVPADALGRRPVVFELPLHPAPPAKRPRS